jgi:hypothetical protein
LKLFGFKPGAQPGVKDLRVAIPELWFQAALDSQMAQLEFNVLRTPGKIAPDVVGADVQASYPVTFAVSFYNHVSTCSFGAFEPSRD